MNKKDALYFEQFEKDIEKELDICKISDFPISDFPFKNLDDVKNAINNKEISITAPYSHERMQIYGTKGEKLMYYFWLTMPMIIIMTNILLAIITKRWIFIVGVIFSLIGFFTSSQLNPLRKSISGLGALSFLASFFLLEWHWSVIIGSLIFTQIFAMTAREQYIMTVKQRALMSETFFCWMLFNFIIFIIDNKTGKFLQSKS
ncbi:MAG: hypothetical protein ABIJ97_03045 [Bacteroidota bacterium]